MRQGVFSEEDVTDAMSSPSRGGDLWEEPPPPSSSPARSKLRLMCSCGGHIVPRPHDKTLCYVGGETRIVTLDRRKTLADLQARLSRSFLPGRAFSIKYQLPDEDLDSLISIATEDDFQNMIDEYDRIPEGSPRIRLFLFSSSQSSSPRSLLEGSKSETWFVDALNGGALRRDPSSGDSSVSCLLGPDDLDQITTLFPAQQSDEEIADPRTENPNPSSYLRDDNLLSLLDPPPVPPQQEMTSQIPLQQFVHPLPHLPPPSSYIPIPIHPHQSIPMYYVPVLHQGGQFVGYHPLQQNSAASSGYAFEFPQNRDSPS